VTAAATSSYLAPRTLGEAVAAASGATILGGGTIVMAQKARGEIEPARLVDLAGIDELHRISASEDQVLLGSMVTYADLLRHPDARVPLLRTMCRGITGGPQIRAQGTLGGAACQANPASDVPGGLVALGATMLVRGPAGTRSIPAATFFRGALLTDLDDGELLVGMGIPRHRAQWGYVKLKGSESSWPITTAAARRDTESGQVVVTVGGAGEVPVTVTLAGTPERGRTLAPSDRALLHDQLIAAVTGWWEDELADVGYRRRVAPVIALRAVETALHDEGN
jgi:aerobic carbon-monoxide dehydrogenase medium subunit